MGNSQSHLKNAEKSTLCVGEIKPIMLFSEQSHFQDSLTIPPLSYRAGQYLWAFCGAQPCGELSIQPGLVTAPLEDARMPCRSNPGLVAAPLEDARMPCSSNPGLVAAPLEDARMPCSSNPGLVTAPLEAARMPCSSNPGLVAAPLEDARMPCSSNPGLVAAPLEDARMPCSSNPGLVTAPLEAARMPCSSNPGLAAALLEDARMPCSSNPGLVAAPLEAARMPCSSNPGLVAAPPEDARMPCSSNTHVVLIKDLVNECHNACNLATTEENYGLFHDVITCANEYFVVTGSSKELMQDLNEHYTYKQSMCAAAAADDDDDDCSLSITEEKDESFDDLGICASQNVRVSVPVIELNHTHEASCSAVIGEHSNDINICPNQNTGSHYDCDELCAEKSDPLLGEGTSMICDHADNLDVQIENLVWIYLTEKCLLDKESLHDDPNVNFVDFSPTSSVMSHDSVLLNEHLHHSVTASDVTQQSSSDLNTLSTNKVLKKSETQAQPRLKSKVKSQQEQKAAAKTETANTAQKKQKKAQEQRTKKCALKSLSAPIYSKLNAPTYKISEGSIKKVLPAQWTCIQRCPMPVCLLLELHPDRDEYEKVALAFKADVKRRNIEAITRVENPYLWFSYQLKVEENKKSNVSFKEVSLFHGTKAENVESICVNNFNWRHFGTNVGHKFGKGVCFSSSAAYALTYTDNFPVFGNQMLLARVLISNLCHGKKDMALPPKGFDTSMGMNGKVFVKYEDNTFYPEYIITFSGKIVK